MPKPPPKKVNRVIRFFKRNWIFILVITALLMVCKNEYVSNVLEYKDSFQIAFSLIGLALGCLILAFFVMLLLRLIEWGLGKL